VIGICGGYQMLGRTVHDPLGIEGGTLETPGLALLDVETEMAPEKTVRNSHARSTEYDVPLAGYQIHLGITRGPDGTRPSAIIDGAHDGALSADGLIMGTYLHGLFGSDAYRARLLQSFGLSGERRNYRESVEQALDEIAGELERHLDRRWLAGLLG
jgi:adenosylcobyric acid synthase